ncbi:2,4'-dihydroxyacetophenone dioxygenase family protein [Streptomyces sp. NBC_01220]|uniref:2,4'-dihydroxyacetophenone dioxygenase family protein n=1 Tax=unclassified Streptomyces TaxID=2593676 RepID=UPI002E27E80B|nr:MULTISPECIES: 2,4'-dihydroxyacetophenone dioxygenase family protein [unclassified Streptomyces]WSQ45771.1 2,4'-dihydroxyacetophenone dioxygenase family protein [Streptomyces sp. NBC_01220]
MADQPSAAKLPVMSLPQGELLTLNVNDIPVIKDSLGPGIHYQPLFLDPEVGVWVVLAHFAPGSELPIHLHTGAVHAYTLKGSWAYREYPDQPQTEGSYLYEPGASVHKLFVPESNTEDTVVLYVVYGANINFSDDGQFHSVLDAVTIQGLTAQLAQAQGLGDINYLTGGAARYAAAKEA